MRNKLFVIISALMGFVVASSAAARPDLTGHVKNEDGSPLPKASVFIYTAGPKVGTGTLCPSCYPDCQKHAKTDANGDFKIEGLDPNLQFRLLVVAGDHEPKFVTKVDPAKGPTEVTLSKFSVDTEKTKGRIVGMVLGSQGQPLSGAVFSVEGIGRGDSTRWGGNEKDADPVCVSDDDGKFVLRCNEEVTTVHATVEGPGHAKRWIKMVPGRDYVVRMDEGVAITGRLVRDGQPLKDVTIGLITTERQCGICLHDFDAVTNEKGEFTLRNVTPKNSFYLFAKMDSLRGRGSLPVRTVNTAKSGTTINLGDLVIDKGYRVEGIVKLSDGKPLPANTTVLVSREDAWDHTEVKLGEDGEFIVDGLPDESISINVRVKGYKFSKRNPSLDWLNGGIIGHVKEDISNFVLLMEPGEWRHGQEEQDMPPGAERYPEKEPLRGVKM